MKINQPGVYLDHMLRQTRNHHVQLSSMADLKANILLTLASVVTSLSFRFVTDPLLKFPAIILIAFSLLTIVLAIYTVMPKINYPMKHGEKPDINSPNFNLLFFGNFVHLNYDEFEDAMEEVMNDPSKTYEAQVREIYTLGRFLAVKKYRFVRWAYMAFISGILFSGTVLVVMGLLE